LEVEPAEDTDGLNTQVYVSMEMEVNSQAVRQEEVVLVEDAYALDNNLSLNRVPVNLVTDERELTENYDVPQPESGWRMRTTIWMRSIW
jgi:hypothetical protein